MDAAALERTSAPALLAAHARAKPGEVAFRSKARGIYRERTWRDCAVLVGRTARALQALGYLSDEVEVRTARASSGRAPRCPA